MNSQKFEEIISSSEHIISELEIIEQDDVRNYLPELKQSISFLNTGGMELLKDSETLRIGVVGQMNVGKSSFLNSLFFNGDNILPKAATPMTAGLTVLQYTEERSRFEVEYFTREEWKVFENDNRIYIRVESDIREEFRDEPNEVILRKIKDHTTDTQRAAHEIINKCRAADRIDKDVDTVFFDSIQELQNILEKYVGANGKFTSVVKSLNIYLNDERLKGVQIVDTPGVNDPIISREKRTRDFLQACHGVFFMSFSSRFFDSTDASFIDERIGKQGVGLILMLACKFDSVLQNLGMKYKGKESGLELAIEEAQMKLKEEFETKRSMLECKDLQFAFDTTSGIGFAIAQKKPEMWDDVEAHVVKQMQTFYPEYFGTDEDIKENFLALANFDTIKDEYLQKLFIENKKNIINHKIEEYFTLNKKSINDLIKHILEVLNSKHKLIQSTTMDDLLRQKREMSKLFAKLKKLADGGIKSIGFFDKFGKEIQDDLKELEKKELIKKEYFPDLSKNFPTEQGTISIRHNSYMFFHSTSSFVITLVDRFKLSNLILPSLDKYAEKLSDGWEHLLKIRKEELFNKFCEVIKDFANESGLDDTAYRDIMDKFLTTLNGYRILEGLDDVKRKHQIDIANSIDNNEHTTFTQDYNCKKSEVQQKVNDEATQRIEYLRKHFHYMIDAANKELNDIADTNVKRLVMDNLPQIKAEMSETWNEASEEYFKQLEREITSKQQTLNKIEKAIDLFAKLEKLY